MALIDPSALRTEVASELPNVPNPAVDLYIIRSVRMLCEQAAVWQVTGDATNSGNVLDLSALEDADREVISIMPRGVLQGSTRLPQYLRPDPGSGTTPGFYIKSRRTLILTQPAGTVAYTVTARMRPALGAGKVPEDVLHDFQEAIVHGALYRLLRMPGETWANPELAAVHYQQFMLGAKQARAVVPRIHAS